MSKKRNLLAVLIEIIILLIFIRPMFNLNYFTGIFYVIAILYAFYKGLITKRKWISWMIIFGTILSYFAGTQLPKVFESYLAGDITSAIIIAILMITLWLKGRSLKKGKKKLL